MNQAIKQLVAGACISLSLLGATASQARPGGDGPMASPRMLEHMASELELSDPQRAEIKTVMSQGEETLEADRQRLRELKAQLREPDGAFDAGQAQRLADELGEVTARMAYAMAAKQAELRAILSPEQRQELDSLRDQRQQLGPRGRHAGHRGDKAPDR